MSMQTLIIRGNDCAPDRFWCQTCNDHRLVLSDADGARNHVAIHPGHVIQVTVVRHDLMVAGGDLWVVAPRTMDAPAEGPSEA